MAVYWKNRFQTKNQPTQYVSVYIFMERQLSGKGLISFNLYQGQLVRENNTSRETKFAGAIESGMKNNYYLLIR